ncbi:hypothetical protein [Plebeiibacterium sediminum]|uniref:Uncharacterized protein n=1 Tax=Plebeiibacterium sediminum TaxID=2992112 RepID=A0AAE3MAE6_9BACT|nr:hypothetical protein [Plebeiobacterium sediminum]MCW3789710.1 hypothetical protein [Plebeiobacterium sediminum]
MKVVALPQVREYLKELSQVLYENEYFGFEESAIKYVEDLFKDIETTLHRRQKRQAPSYFDRFGKNMFYATFKRSKNTQWFVFFTIYEKNNELIYLVRHITNNHVSSQYL